MTASTIRKFMPLVLGFAGLAGTACADEGLWLLSRPPVKLLRDKYGFDPAPAWLEHLQKSCVRMGASGSFISPHGLILTNHHVGYRQLEKHSTPERDLLATGFYARTPAEELKCPDMAVRVLWSIEDVTDRINAAEQPGMTPVEALAARRKAMVSLEQEAAQKTGLDCDVVTLYHGARYHLYSYKRYTDVRLVMAPERAAAAFGGDPDNFEYPRFDLDMCYFRVYEHDQPLACEHYLRWSRDGAADGELTFVLGHPHRTQRFYTLEHLKFLRDVDIPGQLDAVCRREVLWSVFSQRSAENAREASGEYVGQQNRRKSLLGIMDALLDPQLWAAKEADEVKLRAAVAADPQMQAKWGDAWDQVAGAQRCLREFEGRYSLLQGRVFGSDLLRIAMTLVRLAEERSKPDADRLREYRDAELESTYRQLYSRAPIYDALELNRLSNGLMSLAEQFGGDDPLVLQALAGRSPQARAEQLVADCTFKEVEARRRLAEGGAAAIEASPDPLIGLARALDPTVRFLRKRYEDEVESVERESYARIAAARFAVQGEDVYPDATGTLRLSFGPISGYVENGQPIPPFTTFAGMYKRCAEHQNQPPYDLPKRWLDRKDRLNLDTPLNFVCTADIIGGNSGSPVVNRAGEVVGLIFDGNLQGLAWDIAYTDTQARAVAVDSRAIIEALRKIYDADALADEIVGK